MRARAALVLYVGMVDGHYAFDTKDAEALTLLASKCNLPWRNGCIRVPVAVDAQPGDVVDVQANGETVSVTVPLTTCRGRAALGLC